MRTTIVGCTVGLALLVVGCASGDPTTSAEYQALEEEYVVVQQQLDEAVNGRDALAAQIAVADVRHELTVVNQAALAEIIADPTAYGSEEEALDLLMGYAIDDAVMDDVALGSIGMREAWRETIFWTDSDIETFATWIADDGSNGGSLWVWSGLATNGEPFDLVGVNIDTYNDDGLITYERVVWPYPDAYVQQALENGTPHP